MAGKDKQTFLHRPTEQTGGPRKKKHQSECISRKGGDRICGSTGELCNPMKVMKVTASTENEICPAIETWETGNRWLSKGKRARKRG